MKVPPHLQREWDERLAAEGFKDIEDRKGRLKGPNKRTKAWASADATAEFYALLDVYLQERTELSRLERRILELYAQGTRLEAIAWEVFRSLAYVKSKVYLHRDRILHKK